MDDPAQTVTTCNRIALVSVSTDRPEAFCMKYHSTGHNTFGVEEPCSTLPCNDSVGIVQAEQFISLYYSGDKYGQSVDSPGAALTTIPKHRLVSAFIADPQWFGHSHSIESPGNTIIARQDKNPLSLVSTEFITQRNGHDHRNTSLDQPAKTITTTGGNMEMVQCVKHWAYLETAEGHWHPVILVYETDSEVVRKIKAFMAEYGIVDILMRMLKVLELKLIQGFPATYILKGSQTHQKKFIGNSVPPPYVKAWIEAIAGAFKTVIPV